VHGQPHHLVGQQLQRPAGPSFGRLRARHGDEQRFIDHTEFSLCAGPGQLAQRPIQTLFDEALLGSVDRRGADCDVPGNLFVAGALVCGEQDLGSLEVRRYAPLPPSTSEASSARSEFFGVTPPSVHQMIVQLEKLGLIRRTPRQARSIELLVPEEELPRLQPIKASVAGY
jgi:hypothetical protein